MANEATVQSGSASDLEGMKIIEGLKKLKLIVKKINDNKKRITDYSSMLNTEKAIFTDEATQAKEVASLVQANLDLVKEYANLKSRIDYTNLATKVKFQGQEYSIHTLMQYRRTLGKLNVETFNALNDSVATTRFRSVASGQQDVKVIRLYDEKAKQNKMAQIVDFNESIDSRLETVNATTELLDLPLSFLTL